jgi:glycosyltransferase involved in cell wall biosynthesis
MTTAMRHDRLQLVCDGIIFENQAHGGVSRINREILPRLCEIDESLDITLLISGRPQQLLPSHPRIHHARVLPLDRLLRPKRLFYWNMRQSVRALLQDYYLSGATDGIWHSSYYTLPRTWTGRVAVTVPDLLHERFPELFGRAVDNQFRDHKQRCLSKADKIVCISESTREDLLQQYNTDSERVAVVPLAASENFKRLDTAVNELSAQRQKPFLLYVGARYHYKNFTLLVSAYQAWKGNKEIDLVVVGPDWTRQERMLLSRLGVEKNVQLVVGVDDDQLCRLYNLALAFVYPSLYEGFGIPLVEAMACGCPIVASRIPSSIEVASECAVFFEPTDVGELVNALENVTSDGRGSSRVRKGIARAASYSWDATARDMLAIYKSMDNCGSF